MTGKAKKRQNKEIGENQKICESQCHERKKTTQLHA